MRRPLIAATTAPAIVLILWLALAGTAVADTPDTRAEIHADGTHDASTVVCRFHVHFYAAPGDPDEAGYWEIRDDDRNIVLEGQYAGPESMSPASGAFDLPDGSYEVRWDDEPVDSSRGELEFDVDCAAETPSGSELPTGGVSESAAPTGSELPTGGVSESAAPTGSELPIGGVNETPTPPQSEAPTGEELPLQGTPTTTLPPTDVAAEPAGSAWILPILGLLALVSASLLALTPPAAATIRRRR